jgi:hypothetical protein
VGRRTFAIGVILVTFPCVLALAGPPAPTAASGGTTRLILPGVSGELAVGMPLETARSVLPGAYLKGGDLVHKPEPGGALPDYQLTVTFERGLLARLKAECFGHDGCASSTLEPLESLLRKAAGAPKCRAANDVNTCTWQQGAVRYEKVNQWNGDDREVFEYWLIGTAAPGRKGK